MKKLIFIVIILAALIFPAAVFSEVQIGPTAFYNFPLIQDSQLAIPSLDGIDISDFTFGADFRLKLSIFQASATALFTPGSTGLNVYGATVTLPSSADVFLDAGLAVDIAFLRLGLGAGPNFSFYLGDSSSITAPVSAGVNLKATADILLGPVSVGLSYLSQFNFDLQDITNIISADKTKGLFGVSVLMRLGTKK